MNNKLFSLLVLLIILPFFGWIYYDWKTDSETVRNDGLQHDVLTDGQGESSAPIQYLFHFPDPVYSHLLSTSQIEGLSQSDGEAEHYHVFGLTQAGYSSGTEYEVNWSKKWFKEEYSLWVENLRVEFTYDSLNVYVSSAYSEGSCEYQATLDHENEHVSIHRKMYLRYQKELRDTFARSGEIPLPSKPVAASSVEEGKRIVGERISSVLDPVFKKYKDDLEGEQAKLDSPESYAELKGKCQHW